MKCSCNVCSVHIEFDASMVGQRVTCPGCGAETVLALQVDGNSFTLSIPENEEIWAEAIREVFGDHEIEVKVLPQVLPEDESVEGQKDHPKE